MNLSEGLGNLEIRPRVLNDDVLAINLGKAEPRIPGDVTFVSLSNLQCFVADDYLIGKLDSLELLPYLRVLSVSGNPTLSGDVNYFLLNKNNLSIFQLNNCSLSGIFPDMTPLTALTNFNICNNNITGYVGTLSANTNLKGFYVASNQLTAFLPTTLPPNVQVIDVSNNFLDKTSTFNVLSASASLKKNNKGGNNYLIDISGDNMPSIKLLPPFTGVELSMANLYSYLTSSPYPWTVKANSYAPTYVPGKPTIFTTNVSNSALAVSWAPTFDGNIGIDSYTLSLSVETGNDQYKVTDYTLSSNVTSLSVDNIENFSLYSMKVKATNRLGDSVCSDIEYAVPVPDIEAEDNRDILNATVLTPQMFGAVGNGKKNDRSSIQSMLTSVVNNDYVVYDFGTSTYYISGTDITTWSPGFPMLHVNVSVQNKAYKKRWFKGNGAKITTDHKGPYEGNCLLTYLLSGESVIFDGLTFERTATIVQADSATNTWGQDGIQIAEISNTIKSDHVRFKNVTFIDCHRGVTVGTVHQELNNDLYNPLRISHGNLKYLLYDSCNWIYPRGSNSTNTAGGYQGNYEGNLVYFTKYTNCFFDGCTAGNTFTVPNQLPVDGWIVDECHRLVVENSTLQHGWVEGIASGIQTGLNFVTEPFYVSTPILNDPKAFMFVKTEGIPTGIYKPGLRVQYSFDGFQSIFHVLSTNSVDKCVTLFNPGSAGNALSGTLCMSGGFIQLPWVPRPNFAYIRNVNYPLSGVRMPPITYGDWANRSGNFYFQPSLRTDAKRTIAKGLSGWVNFLINGYKNYSPITGNANSEISDINSIGTTDFFGVGENAYGYPSFLGIFFQDGIDITRCNYWRPDSSKIGLCSILSKRANVTYCNFDFHTLTQPFSTVYSGIQSYAIGVENKLAENPLDSSSYDNGLGINLYNNTFKNMWQGVIGNGITRGIMGPGNDFYNVVTPYQWNSYTHVFSNTLPLSDPYAFPPGT